MNHLAALAPITLADMLIASTKRSPYFAKDFAKARAATQFIGQGSLGSSTAAYAKATASLANTGTYRAGDVVFVSAEGSRSGRFNPIGATPNGPIATSTSPSPPEPPSSSTNPKTATVLTTSVNVRCHLPHRLRLS